MYTKEQIEIALKEYERLGSVQAVINLLEYPSSSTLYRWYERKIAEKTNYRGSLDKPYIIKEKIINAPNHPRIPDTSLKLDAIKCCFSIGEGVEYVSRDIGYSRASIYSWYRKICTATTVGIIGSSFITGPMHAASAIGEFANVVVLVRFNGDTQGDNGTGFNKPYNSTITNAPRTYWGSLIRKFNGANDTFAGGSFKEYLRNMSCGQHMVESVFPQTNSNDGTVYYLTMDKMVDEYKGSVQEIQLIKEIANQLNTKYPNLDGKMIDKDNDGVVDNLMIIASVQSYGHFVSHATNAGNDTKLAGKGIGPYDLIETHQVIMDLIFIQRHMNTYIRSTGLLPSKLCEASDTPVGIWDPMCIPGGRHWPLAVTREVIGWTKVDEIQPQNGEYTLYEASAAYKDENKRQAIKVKTPFSPTEYFAIEYRKKGERYKFDTFDQTAPADGIIVYRVNPTYKDEGNLRGNDYIYVYRPNDTSITASAG